LTILIVEDDAQVRSLICKILRRDEHEVIAVGSAVEARAAIKSTIPRLVLLDRGLPGGDGLELGQWIRSHCPGVGIIIVTGRAEVSDRIAGLDSGADDYITKPFDMDELNSRVRSLLRRLDSVAAVPAKANRMIGPWEIDPDLCALVNGDATVKLTKSELLLLIALVERPKRAATREWLLDRLDAEENTTERTIDYHVHCLRAKLRDCGLNEGVISSVRGIGYVFTPPNVRHGSEEG
jgi:DNA-binding response OmpR family regulator